MNRKPPIIPSPSPRKKQSINFFQGGTPGSNSAGIGGGNSGPSSLTSSPVPITPSKNAKLFFSRASPMSPQLRDSALINSKISMESSTSADPLMPPSFSSPISLPGTFQNALKPVQSSVSRNSKEVIEDGLVFKDADQTLKMWHAAPHIDVWSENVKKWLAKHVLAGLVERIDKVDATFKSIGWEHLSCEDATFADSLNTSSSSSTGPTIGVSNSLFNGTQQYPTMTSFSGGVGSSFAPKPPQKPNTLTELRQFYGKEPSVEERMSIERYLTSFDTSSNSSSTDTRRQVIERIKLLSRGSGLAQFRWNNTAFPSSLTSSSSNRNFSDASTMNHHHYVYGRNSGSSTGVGGMSGVGHLTDAQLVMTLFCRYLDEKLPGEGYGLSPLHPFTSKYFVDSSVSKPSKHSLSGIKIRQASTFPPHYQLMIDNVVHDVASGRNNIFDTISLFLYQIKMNYNGYLGMLSLAGKSIELIQVVEDTHHYSF